MVSDEDEYKAGTLLAQSMLKHFEIPKLQNTSLGDGHAEAFENGYYDELSRVAKLEGYP